MRKTLLAIFASTVLIGGCAAVDGDDAMSASAVGDLTPEERLPYVTMAAASDLYEIQAGQLAQQNSQNPGVRAFGQMLIDHHNRTTQQLTAAARASGMNPPPPALMPMQQNMIRELQQASGPAFDRAFLRQQVQAHEMALNLHRNYASNGDTPALRTVAGAAVPIITQHLERARQMD